jgi:hypothetical protein
VRSIRVILALAVAGAFALATPAGEEKTNLPAFGTEKLLLKKDDPTAAGSFDGTWMYVNRDSRFALWARTKDGVPQVKIQFQSLANPEAFETDWDGKAVYYLAGTPVTFELKLGACNADQILGAWSWILETEQTARRETADIVIHRTGNGRTLLLDFQNYQKKLRRGGEEKSIRIPLAWTWTKVSKRELLWDEIPF